MKYYNKRKYDYKVKKKQKNTKIYIPKQNNDKKKKKSSQYN